MTEQQLSRTGRRNPFGLPFLALLGLAALGLPRVVLHDLGIIDESHPLSWVFALGALAATVAAALIAKVPSPFLTVLAVGSIFGVMLVITHQLFWDVKYGGNPPVVAGSEVIPQIAAAASGLFTGVIMGVVGGLLAWGLQAILRRAKQ
ncbi:hypothetical protein ACFFGH_19815 [Lysobacter korlensis]|uniref:Uncharacterized protein n=1 Tax=Lysobacter korlensis TaxID=553636 RepID=A0ABV6RSX8_9GAMM